MTRDLSAAALLAPALLVFCVGCSSGGRGDGSGSGAPNIVSFTANPQTIQPGGASVLSWNVSGATVLSIDQGVGSVTGTSRTVSPTSTTSYTLTATNDAGSVTAQAAVNVTPPACMVNQACQPSNLCTIGITSCASSTSEPTCVLTGNKADGTACEDGHVCSSGTCVAACTPTQACDPSDVCKLGSTSCASAWATPACSVVGNKPDGVGCGGNKVCMAGACVVPTSISRVYVNDAIAITNQQVTLTANVTVGSGSPTLELDWTVDSESAGHVTPGRGTTTTFTAPSTPGKYKVWATSVAEPTKKDFAYVTVALPHDSWRRRASMQVPRTSVAAAAVHGKIYAIGGTDSNGRDSATVEAYDPVSNAWSFRAPLPAPRTSHAAVASNGYIYVLGGTTDGSFAATLQRYDPVANSWAAGADLQTRRVGLAAASLRGLIYAFGGTLSGPYAPYADSRLDLYDPVTDVWTTRAEMPFSVNSLAGAAFESTVYGIQGVGRHGMFCAAQAYLPDSDSWTALSTSVCRGGLTAGVVEGRIYAVGGWQGYPTSSGLGPVQELDPVAGDTWADRAQLPTARSGLGSAVVDGKLYAVGGSTEDGAVTGAVEEYTPPGSTGALVLGAGRQPFGMLFDGDSVWVANTAEGSVAMIRANSGVVRRTVAIGSNPRGAISFDGANVWVTNTGSNSVTKLQVSDGAPVGTFSVGSMPHGSAFDGEHIWVANYGDNSVTKLRARDGVSLGSFAVGPAPTGVAFDGANIWVATSTEITKLDKNGARIGAFTPVHDPYGVVFDGTSLWFANHGANTVARFRPNDGVLLGTYAVGRAPIGLAVAGGSIWVTNTGENTVTELRTSDGAALATLKTGSIPYGVTIADGHPWVADYGSNDVRRLY